MSVPHLRTSVLQESNTANLIVNRASFGVLFFLCGKFFLLCHNLAQVVSTFVAVKIIKKEEL